jgi:thiosulfate/3-mercaptopyruvate sulfurtransferase
MKTRELISTTPCWSALLSLLLITLFTAGCSEDETPPVEPIPEPSKLASCEGCHTDYAALKTLAEPDTGGGGGGCGGEVPHIEVYDRVYLGGDGYEAFKQTTHGAMSCTECHGGKDSTDDKSLAHSGSFNASPSHNADVHCAPCHSAIAGDHANSLHAQGWGQKSMVTLRYGGGSFDDLPEALRQGYTNNCSGCHASCGDCHVNRPHAGGGGLYNGHEFSRQPSMRDNCAACHSSRIAHGFFGIGSGTLPDVHQTAGLECMSCHSKQELHGDGLEYNQRYQMPLLPDCVNCHGSIGSSNMYHSVHLTTFNCQTCHSQNYNNCGSCHIGGDGARIPAYLGFKIGMNPLPDTKTYKFATLRRSLMAPDSWELYGVPALQSFDVRPTFKYTTPHNIQRWTSRTNVAAGAGCFENCHIVNDQGVYRNKELYLFNSDLQNWELDANSDIVVDDRLPASWGDPH